MPVSAFITKTDEEQREQFMLVNSTKPLPKSLLNELSPYTNGRLPSELQAKKFASYLTLCMNFEDGPLNGRIKTATNPSGTIADTSIIKMIDALKVHIGNLNVPTGKLYVQTALCLHNGYLYSNGMQWCKLFVICI